MWVKASGSISDNVVQVTTAVSSHFVVCSEKIALVDTSVAGVFKQIFSQLDNIYADGGSLDYILLTHAHFDHIGGLPLFREKSSETKIIASPATAEILADKDYLKSAWSWNKLVCESMGQKMPITQKKWLDSFSINQVLGDGDGIDLGEGVTVKGISVPGHTEDCTAYFVLPDAVLQAGEAVGGYHGREVMTSTFQANYQKFLASIDKLLSLEIRGIGLPHGGSLSGDLARNHLVSVRQEAERFFNDTKERIGQGELIQDIVDSLVAEWRSEGKTPEGPFNSSLEQLLSGMVETVAKT